MKLKANHKYEYENYLIFIDHIDIKNVYFRQWKDKDLVGLFRMPIKRFKKEIKCAKLVDTADEVT